MFLIKNGTVRRIMNGRVQYQQEDILVENNLIKKMGRNIVCEQATVINAENKLVIPGLINCHIHSHDNFNRAWLDNVPLEIWMPMVRPFYNGVRHTPEQVYYRTILGAVEMLHTGTTAVMDDVILNSILDNECLEMVIKAYEDIGIRAVVAPHTKNIPMEKTIPYAEELFTEKMKEATNIAYPKEAEILEFMDRNLQKYNQAGRTVTMGLSSSAPQRSTPELMNGLKELSLRYHVPVSCHVLETYVQKQTGDLFYGKSLVKYLEELDLLNSNIVLIHCNWVDEADMEIIKKYDSKTVHNPVCNMKMGSGIAPVYEMVHNFPVGLGTDNISANDSANIFEAMKACGLLNKIHDPDFRNWVDAETIVNMATSFGSKCLRKENEIGSLEEGKKADIVLLEMNNEHFVMAADYDKALVYGESGSSVDTVLVDGRIVLKNGKLVNMDEEKIFSNLRQIRDTILAEHKLAYKESENVTEIFEQCYRRCNQSRFKRRGRFHV